MKISYNWLKNYLDINLSPSKVSEILTDLGLEIEGLETYHNIKGCLKGVLVGEVLSCDKHPNADKLKCTVVDLGFEKPLHIVCGASNVSQGQKVPVATIGTEIYLKDGSSFTIKESKIRGELSQGMICAEDELGLGSSHEGIMVLDKDIKVGTPLSELFDVSQDYIFEIGLTPNRADAMSHFGVARDLAARLNFMGENLSLNFPQTDIEQSKEEPIEIVVHNDELAPRYCGLVIKGLKVEPSPKWLQNSLKSIGLNPINNVVDITNYVLHSLGQPIHTFDLKQIEGNQIHIKTCDENTEFITLDSVTRKLNGTELMVCSQKQPMCIAGVFGGKKSGISNDTTDIFIESAYFSPVSVRKTSKYHSLSTDASFRFERGIDPNITLEALKLTAKLILEIAGGKISSKIYDIKSQNFGQPFIVNLKFETIKRILGQQIEKDKIKSILKNLQIEIEEQTNQSLLSKIPPYRVDVQREADVVEEILRIYGFNNIEISPYLKTSIVSSDKFSSELLYNKVADFLAASGFNEMLSNSLTQSSYNDILPSLEDKNTVYILNPLSSELNSMRRTLLFSALEAIKRNINYKNFDLKLFEYGKIYFKNNQSEYFEEPRLCLFITGKQNAEIWHKKQDESSFFTLKAEVEKLLNKLALSDLKQKPGESEVFSQSISLYSGKTKIAEIGTIKTDILKKFDILQPVYYAEMIWENILKEIKNVEFKFREPAKYPLVRRDLALLLDEDVSYSCLYSLAFQTERNYLKQMSLFDVYQGGKMPEGKKSYAVSFILGDDESTLNDKKIEQIMSKIQNAFQKEFNAQLRN